MTTPHCCPSRATFLRGQYTHNHGTLHGRPPNGGWQKFRSDGRESSTIATWLNAAGYTTGHMGKYLNGYGSEHTTTYVPPGWDRWWGWQGGYNQFGDHYKINEDGRSGPTTEISCTTPTTSPAGPRRSCAAAATRRSPDS